jgi:ribokinase
MGRTVVTMRRSRSFRQNVLAIGSVYLDINVADFPFETGLPVEEEIVGGRYQAPPGGSAANFSNIAAMLGMRPILVGKIGKDAVGHLLRTILVQHAIRPDLIQSEEVATNVGINVVNRAGQRVMIVLGTANQSLTPKEIIHRLDRHVGRSAYLYLGGYFKLKSLSSFFPTIVQRAKQAGLSVIIDHGRITNTVSKSEVQSLRALLRQLSDDDYYLPAEEEFLEVFAARDLERGLASFRRSSPATVIVKQSGRGATSMIGKKIVFGQAYSVRPQETVGAGDAFNAGFIKAQAEARTFEESMRFANATAAVKISRPGPLTIGDIEKLAGFRISRGREEHPRK